MNKNIQNELLEISKKITDELLNSFKENFPKGLHYQTEHQREALLAVMRNSPLLKEFISSNLLEQTLFVSPESSSKSITKMGGETNLEREFIFESVRTVFYNDILLPINLLIDLIKVYVNNKDSESRDILNLIRKIISNRDYIGQSLDDVVEFILNILDGDKVQECTRALEILECTPPIVLRNSKIKGIISKLFEEIINRKGRDSLDFDYRILVLRCYFLIEFDLNFIPYGVFLEIVEQSYPANGSKKIKEVIEWVVKYAVNRLKIAISLNSLENNLRFAYLVIYLAPFAEDKSIPEKYFNCFINSDATHDSLLTLGKASRKILSSYLIAKYGGSKEDIAIKCFNEYEKFALFLIAALYDGEQIPVTVLGKIYRVDYDFNYDFNWFSEEVARQYSKNELNDDIVMLFLPFLDLKEKQCKVIEVLDQIDHFGLSAPKVYAILLRLMNFMIDKTEREKNMESLENNYDFLLKNLSKLPDLWQMIDVPEYFARQAKFGNKDKIIELLVKGYCNEIDTHFSDRCFNGLSMFVVGDISESLKLKVRTRWFKKKDLPFADNVIVDKFELYSLMKLNILTIKDMITDLDVYLSNFSSIKDDWVVNCVHGSIISICHDSGYRLLTSETDEGASIISIEQLSEIN